MSLWGVSPEESLLVQGLLCILRVPGFFLLDIWWVERSGSTFPSSLEAEELFDTAIDLAIILAGLSLLLLPLADLVHVYMHGVGALSLYLAHLVASQLLHKDVHDKTAPRNISAKYTRYALSLVSFGALTLTSNWCLDGMKSKYGFLFPGIYCLPVILRALGASNDLFQWSMNIVDVFTVICGAYFFLSALNKALTYVSKVQELYSAVRIELGNHQLLLLVLQRALQPPVLVLYWLVLFGSEVWNTVWEVSEKKYIIKDSDMLIETVVAISEICESPLILISFCTTIMFVSKTVMDVLREVFGLVGGGQVGGENPLAHTGFTEGVVAFVLAIQTDLIELGMPARIGATSIILFVVAGTILQSAFEVTDPVLMALPALNPRWVRHLPVLLVMLVILLIPVLMLHAILSKVSSDMWILVVVSSYVVTIVQGVGSLATYSLFMWDSCQPEPSNYMDDYVFYIKAVTKTCEFLMALSIVSGGVYEIMVNEDELSLINIGILIIHFYFNVYQRINSGWKTFMARRQTKKRLSVLEDATAEELREHQDVCSICYQDMTTAKKTKCGHIFHQNCLKRWLFVQDNCPMCTAPIIQVPKPQQPTEDQPNQGQVHPDPAQVHPEPAQVHPETAQVHPETAQVHPETAQVNPEPAQVHPETAQVHPESAQVNPESAQVNPEPAQVNPEPAQVHQEPAQFHPEPVQAGSQLTAGLGEPHYKLNYELPDVVAGCNREADGAFPGLASINTSTRDKVENSIHADNIDFPEPVRIPSETCFSSSTLHGRNQKDLTDEDSFGENQVGSSAEGSEVLTDCDSPRESPECQGGGDGLRQRFVSEHNQPLQSK